MTFDIQPTLAASYVVGRSKMLPERVRFISVSNDGSDVARVLKVV